MYFLIFEESWQILTVFDPESTVWFAWCHQVVLRLGWRLCHHALDQCLGMHEIVYRLFLSTFNVVGIPSQMNPPKIPLNHEKPP